MKIVAQDRPIGVSHHRAERLRHAHPEMASGRLSTIVGAQHAAPLRLLKLVLRTATGSSVGSAACVRLAARKPPTNFCRGGLGFSMNLDVRIPRREILDDSATRNGF
jgi:hypothetical protein